MLYEAAHSLLTHSRQWSWLKAWGVRVAAEFCPVAPHAVQHRREFARDRDERLSSPDPLGQGVALQIPMMSPADSEKMSPGDTR